MKPRSNRLKRAPAGALGARRGHNRAPGPSESQIQRSVVRHLEIHARPGVVFYHPANGGKRSKVEAARFKAEGVRRGVPDIAIVANGRPLYLELKTAKGRLSPEQADMHCDLVAAGAEVAVAHGIDEAIAQLATWGLLR